MGFELFETWCTPGLPFLWLSVFGSLNAKKVVLPDGFRSELDENFGLDSIWADERKESASAMFVETSSEYEGKNSLRSNRNGRCAL